MTKRPVTSDELKLWREENRLTKLSPRRKPGSQAKNTNIPVLPEIPAFAGMTDQGAKVRLSTRAPLKPLSQREAKRIFKPYGPIEATLDLHGLSKLDAYESVQQFIVTQHQNKRRHVVIITGKGRGGEIGLLRSNLPHWLNEHSVRVFVSAFVYAAPEKGGEGLAHVLLKAR